MKKHFFLMSWLFALLCASFFVALQSKALFAQEATITGTITDENGQPINGAWVQTYIQYDGINWQPFLYIQTGQDGQYALTSVNAPSNVFRVRFSASNYAEEYFDNVANIDSATSITVENLVSEINAALGPEVTFISGMVTSEANEPITNIGVAAYRATELPGFPTAASSDITDEHGNFELRGLSAGDYLIHYYDLTQPRRYATEFFNNSTSLLSATVVTLVAGMTTSDINAQLSSLGSISGKVTDKSDNPLDQVTVAVERFDGPISGWQSWSNVSTGVDGRFFISDLDTGRYRFSLIDSRDPQQFVSLGYIYETEIAPGANVDSSTFTLSKRGQMQGRVTDLNGTPLAGIGVAAMQFDGVINSWATIGGVGTDTNGNYTIVGLPPGIYRVSFFDNDPADGSQIAESYDDVATIEIAADVIVSDGGTTSNINAQLATLGSIQGHVSDRQGNPLADIQVLIYFPSWSPWQAVNSDSKGFYHFSGLPAGSYRIEFSDTHLPIRFVKEFHNSASSVAQATTIIVTNGNQSVVDAQLAPANQLSGTVIDQNGSPILGINVSLYRSDGANSSLTYPAYTMQTSATGQYIIEGIDQGSYRLGFLDPIQPRRYSDQYFENALSVQEAQNLVFSSGESRTIDAELGNTGEIKGTIKLPDGQPAAGVTIGLTTLILGSNERNSVTSAQTDENGKYAMTNIGAGIYQLCFFDPNPSQPTYSTQCYEQKGWTDADDLRLQSGESRTVDFVLGYTGAIQGKVTNAAGEPLSGQGVQTALYQQNIKGEWYGGAYFGYLSDSGEYHFANLDVGKYRICFYHEPAIYASECYDNALAVSDGTDVMVTSGITTTVPDVQLDRLSLIEGKVIDSAGNPLENIQASVFSRQNPTIYGWSPKISTYTDVNGEYQLRGVPAGTVRLGFEDPFNHQYQPEYFDNNYYVQLADDITVPISSTLTGINAQLDLDSNIQVAPIAFSKSISVTRAGTVGSADYLESPFIEYLDADFGFITPTIITQPGHGSFLLTPAKAFSYTHNGDAAISDFVTYKVTDGLLSSELATVTITIFDKVPTESIVLTKSVGIAGIKPVCGEANQLRVPMSTTVVYCYTLQNNSPYTLNLHSLVDERLGLLFENQVIAMGPTQNYTALYSETLTISASSIATWTTQVGTVQASTQSASVAANALASITISNDQDDQDQDTISDNLEGASDLDGDNLPNFLDSDADGDATVDQDEAADSNEDGIPDFLDPLLPTLANRVFLPTVSR